MRHIKLWVLAAILVSGASFFSACSINDSPVSAQPSTESFETINITEDDLTDGTYYYKLFVSDKTMDYSSVKGEDGLYYGDNADDWIVCVPTNYLLGYAAKAVMEQVTAVPENTPVLIRVKKPQTYSVRSEVDPASVKAPSANMLAVAEEDITLDGYSECGAKLVERENGVCFYAWMFKETSVAAGDIYMPLTEAQNTNLGLYLLLGYSDPILLFPDGESPAVNVENCFGVRAYTEGKINLKLSNAKVTMAWESADEDIIDNGLVMIEDESAAVTVSYFLQWFPGLASKVAVGDVLNGTIELEVLLQDGIPVYTPTQKALDNFETTVTRTAGTAVPTLLYPDFADADFLATLDCRYIRVNGVSVTKGDGLYNSNQVIDLSSIVPGCIPYMLDAFSVYNEYYWNPVSLVEGAKVDICGFISVYPDGSYTFNPTSITTPVTVGSEGYATFSSDNTLDFTHSSIQAYIAVADGSAITFKHVNKVPAGTGVLLCAKGGATEDVSVVAKTTDDVSGNVLHIAASDMDSAALQAAGAYILGYEGGVAGFYQADGNASLKAGQCYLTAEGAIAPIVVMQE